MSQQLHFPRCFVNLEALFGDTLPYGRVSHTTKRVILKADAIYLRFLHNQIPKKDMPSMVQMPVVLPNHSP